MSEDSDSPSAALSIWLAYNDASNSGDHDLAGRYIDPRLAVLVNGAATVSSAAEDRLIQQELIDCYPDYTRTYEGGLESGDRAVIEWTMRGSAAAGLDLPPLHVPGCSFIRCDGGRIVEARLYHPTGVLDRVAERALSRSDRG